MIHMTVTTRHASNDYNGTVTMANVGNSQSSEATKAFAPTLESPYRAMLNAELQKILDEHFHNHSLIGNLYYHLRLDTFLDEVTIAHSKRLRGLLCLLIAKAVGGDIATAVPVACAIELYHNASLILDDIGDSSEERCGRPALWCKFGVPEAISAAFLLKVAAELTLTRLASNDRYYLTALRELLTTASTMAEGQSRDLQSQDHWHEGTNYYCQTTRLKTGSLLGTSCALGTVARVSLQKRRLFRSFGTSLGLAHQIEDDIDDLLTLRGETARQLDSGNIVYFAASEVGLLGNITQAPKRLIRLVKEEPGLWVELQQRRVVARRHLRKRLAQLPDIASEARANLCEIANVLCHRNDAALGEIIQLGKWKG